MSFQSKIGCRTYLISQTSGHCLLNSALCLLLQFSFLLLPGCFASSPLDVSSNINYSMIDKSLKCGFSQSPSPIHNLRLTQLKQSRKVRTPFAFSFIHKTAITFCLSTFPRQTVPFIAAAALHLIDRAYHKTRSAL